MHKVRSTALGRTWKLKQAKFWVLAKKKMEARNQLVTAMHCLTHHSCYQQLSSQPMVLNLQDPVWEMESQGTVGSILQFLHSQDTAVLTPIVSCSISPSSSSSFSLTFLFFFLHSLIFYLHPPCHSFLPSLYLTTLLYLFSHPFFLHKELPPPALVQTPTLVTMIDKADTQTCRSSKEPDPPRTLPKLTFWCLSKVQEMLKDHSTEQEANPSQEWARPLLTSHLPGRSLRSFV